MLGWILKTHKDINKTHSNTSDFIFLWHKKMNISIINTTKSTYSKDDLGAIKT